MSSTETLKNSHDIQCLRRVANALDHGRLPVLRQIIVNRDAAEILERSGLDNVCGRMKVVIVLREKLRRRADELCPFEFGVVVP
jgi:hypothetical protein